MRWIALTLGMAALCLAGCGTMSAAKQATADCPPGKALPTFDIKLIVGHELSRATAVAQQHGYVVRTLYINGKQQPTTMDYSAQRLNVAVRDGKVTQLCSIA